MCVCVCMRRYACVQICRLIEESLINLSEELSEIPQNCDLVPDLSKLSKCWSIHFFFKLTNAARHFTRFLLPVSQKIQETYYFIQLFFRLFWRHSIFLHRKLMYFSFFFFIFFLSCSLLLNIFLWMKSGRWEWCSGKILFVNRIIC